MKGSVVGAVGVIIILIVIGIVFFRSTGDEALAPADDDVTLVEDANPSAQDVNLIQLQPSDLPDGESEDVVSDERPTSEGAGEVVFVSMGDASYEPNQLTVKAGTTVTFVNDGQALHWPASDVHPTHQALPEFDAKRGLVTGETYSFTFTEIGTWTMHDHLFPNIVGEIVVE